MVTVLTWIVFALAHRTAEGSCQCSDRVVPQAAFGRSIGYSGFSWASKLRIARRSAFLVRGGSQQSTDEEEATLDEKVRKAMIKLGLTPPNVDDDAGNKNSQDSECNGGVCEMPQTSESISNQDADADDIANRLSKEFGVDLSLAMAAVGATRKGDSSYDEVAARRLIQQEMDRINQVDEGSVSVQKLVGEGFDPFLSRRALAFADMNIDDARAILLADQMDQEEAEAEKAAIQKESKPQGQESKIEIKPFKTVTVESDFDPTKIGPQQQPKPTTPTAGASIKHAAKADVVFEAKADEIQELVLESPVPVLLDVYADWCGPCKVLGPALEEMAVKSGGAFRLVKVNTDRERPVSAALEVTALPTVFGICDGKIVNMFQGMPRSEKAMQSFMMGLLAGESHFDPRVTDEQKEKFGELTGKLAKMAGLAAFSFSRRERLQERIKDRLEDLATEADDFVDAEASTRVLRMLLSNVINDPYNPKYRSVNLKNKRIADCVAKYDSSVLILKSVGFRPASESNEDQLELKRKVVNVAPMFIARDAIDKWIDKTRHEVEKAARKRKDEEDRARLQREAEERGETQEEEEEEEEANDVDPTVCTLKLRMEGKKKIHEFTMQADDPLSSVLDLFPVPVKDGEVVQITCVARRLIVKSTDSKFNKSLSELRLTPSSSIVVSVIDETPQREDGDESDGKKKIKASLAQRAKDKKKKTGSHTMQSIGIYSKDDNAKGELIDGGGGVWYEHDVSDDEKDATEEQGAPGDEFGGSLEMAETDNGPESDEEE